MFAALAVPPKVEHIEDDLNEDDLDRSHRY